MRTPLMMIAGALVTAMTGNAAGQTWEEFQRDPRVEQPVPICLVDPRFCEPGDPSQANWTTNDNLMLLFENGDNTRQVQMMLGGGDHGIIVIDPRRVFVGAGGVYIVPDGVDYPFVDRW